MSRATLLDPFRAILCMAASAAIAWSGTACTPPPAPAQPHPLPLPAIVDSVAETPPLDRTHWGIEVYDPDRRRVLYRQNGELHFIPASNTKLVVTAVALGELGPDYRYRTEIHAPGRAPADSIVERLVVLASGDPTLSARFHPTATSPLDSMADSLAAAGIRRVSGELVVDASRFDSVMLHPAWELGDVDFAYAAPVAAFAIAEGTVMVELAPGAAPGEPALARIVGPAGRMHVVNALVTDTAGARRRISPERRPGSDTLRLAGRIPFGMAPDTVAYAVGDPVGLAALALLDALGRRGIAVDGGARVVYDAAEARTLRPADGAPVAAWTSPPMAEIVAAILKPSQNWIAEMVLKTLGAERTGQGSWPAGLAVERRYLQEVAGIDSTAFSLSDGSGLSVQNLLAPTAVVRLLDHARRQPWGPVYRAAQAEPGGEDSTLENRLPGLEGRLFAKTGTITNVNALSGYLTTRSGRELIFSIMTNATGRPAALVRRGIDRLVYAIEAIPD